MHKLTKKGFVKLEERDCQRMMFPGFSKFPMFIYHDREKGKYETYDLELGKPIPGSMANSFNESFEQAWAVLRDFTPEKYSAAREKKLREIAEYGYKKP